MAPQPGAASREGGSSAARTAVFFLYEGAEVHSWKRSRQPGERGGQRRPGWVRVPKVFPTSGLSCPSAAPRLRSRDSGNLRHFVLQEEFELLRSDVWLRCEIFVKGHVAEIDFKTGLFRLKVVLLDLCKSSGVNFRIICGRLKLS